MSAAGTIALEGIMPPRLGSVDPSAFRDEIFVLYSIPAFDDGEPETVEGSEIGSAKQVVKPGDVLLSRIVPHIRRAWVVGEHPGRRIIASGEWIVFRGETVEANYLRRILVSDQFHAEFMRTVSGVGGSLLRARPAYVASIRIPLPPLPEQRRIAEILDKADALRGKRRAAIAQLDTLAQSIFLDTFGDPATNPKGWPVTTVGSVAEVQGGLQVTSARKSLPLDVPYLRVANVYRDSLDLREIKKMRVTEAELVRTTLQKYDLLIVEGHGNPDEIGRGALWDGSIAGCVHQNHLIRARFRRDRVDPVYACTYLNTPGGRRHLLRAGKTTSGLNTISVSEVRATPITVPDIGTQLRFAEFVKKARCLAATHCTSLRELDELFATLQDRAFHD